MTSSRIAPRVLLAARAGEARDRLLAVLADLDADVTQVETQPALFDALGQMVVAQGQPPDAVLVGDIGPGHGLEALRILRRSGWTTPFLLVDGDQEQEARALGALVLAEPIDAQQLRHALRAWLESTGRWRPVVSGEGPTDGSATDGAELDGVERGAAT